MILIQIINLYSYIVIAAIVISWMQLPPTNPIVQLVHAVTEPVLGPLRRALPPMGGLDFSPMVLLIGLQLLKGLLF